MGLVVTPTPDPVNARLSASPKAVACRNDIIVVIFCAGMRDITRFMFAG